MATTINLREILCSDPNYGGVYRMLFNGGSWYEADQMYWRILQQRATIDLQEIIKAKPTASNCEKAQGFLTTLKGTTTQLSPQNDCGEVVQWAEQVVKAWAPAAKAPTVKIQHKKNSFALLDDDEE
jgi:bacterioferritin-associated ferredoxin